MKHIKITYTNHRSETADRIVEPITIWYGQTKWHPTDQWFLKATDVARNLERDFAMINIGNIAHTGVLVDADILAPTPTSTPDLVKAKMYADGGSRGNPGPSALGYVILNMEDIVVKSEGIYLGITTNNQAEYRGVLAGLNTALGMGVKNLEVYLDSMLAVNQINGLWKIKNVDLMPVYDEIKSLLPHFDRVTFTHVPRALNKLADAQVNQCLDAR